MFPRSLDDTPAKPVLVLLGVFTGADGAIVLITTPGWVGLSHGLSMIVLCGVYVIFPRWLRRNYRRGWWQARKDMWLALHEAQARGMRIEDWITAEQERDLAQATIWEVRT